jgi:hypothetical protein
LVTATSVNVDGPVSLSGNLEVQGLATLHDNTVIDGTLEIEGTLTINDNTLINGNLEVDGTLTINDNTVINGDLDIDDLTCLSIAVSGTTTMSGGISSFITSITSNTPLTSVHYQVNVNASGGAVTVTLPAASSNNGRNYIIKKTDSSLNSVTIARTGSDTIDGATSYTVLFQYDSVTLISTGSGWDIVTENATEYGSFVGTFTGIWADTTGTVRYHRNYRFVTLTLPSISTTTNAASFISMSFANAGVSHLRPTTRQRNLIQVINNNAGTPGVAVIREDNGNLEIYGSSNLANFTNGANGGFTNPVITYVI